jgi:hypothetical protein
MSEFHSALIDVSLAEWNLGTLLYPYNPHPRAFARPVLGVCIPIPPTSILRAESGRRNRGERLFGRLAAVLRERLDELAAGLERADEGAADRSGTSNVPRKWLNHAGLRVAANGLQTAGSPLSV